MRLSKPQKVISAFLAVALCSVIWEEGLLLSHESGASVGFPLQSSSGRDPVKMWPTNGLADRKMWKTQPSYIHFGICSNIYQNSDDPGFIIPYMTVFKSVARQSFKNWTYVLVGNADIEDSSILKIWALIEKAGIPKEKVIFRVIDKEFQETGWHVDETGNIKPRFSSRWKGWKKMGFPGMERDFCPFLFSPLKIGTFAQNHALELATQDSIITHVAHIDGDDIWLEDHLQGHVEMYLKFPEISLVQSPSVWLEKGYPYPNLGIEVPSGNMPTMVGNMVPMVNF